jgi:hypothetical protein
MRLCAPKAFLRKEVCACVPQKHSCKHTCKVAQAAKLLRCCSTKLLLLLLPLQHEACCSCLLLCCCSTAHASAS